MAAVEEDADESAATLRGEERRMFLGTVLAATRPTEARSVSLTYVTTPHSFQS